VRYVATLVEPDGRHREVPLSGVVRLSGSARAAASPGDPIGGSRFGEPGWRAALADPPLDLHTAGPDRKLAGLRLVTDPQTSRSLVAAALAETFPGIGVDSCTPTVVRYRPGQRCTVICALSYAHPADPIWPATVVAKVHRRGGGLSGHRALESLASAGVGVSGPLRFAQPLAHLADHDVSLQSHLPQDRDLVDLVSGDGAAATEALREVGGALSVLHGANVAYGPTATLEAEIAALRVSAARLAAALPESAGAIEPLLRLVERAAAGTTADPVVPSHGAFRPAQIRLDGGRVGVVDVDGFCHSEPAQDVGRFLAKLRLLVARAQPQPTGDDGLAAAFVGGYGLPVSAARVALWEILDLVKALVQSWSRGRPDQAPLVVQLLSDRLQHLP
jgi:hypothetical protein